MLKLIICLFCGMGVAVVVLQLRQQRLEMNYQNNRLYGQIEAQQAKLWNQQLQIAVYVAPNAIARTVGAHELNMVPQSPLGAVQANWIEPENNPNAE